MLPERWLFSYVARAPVFKSQLEVPQRTPLVLDGGIRVCPGLTLGNGLTLAFKAGSIDIFGSGFKKQSPRQQHILSETTMGHLGGAAPWIPELLMGSGASPDMWPSPRSPGDQLTASGVQEAVVTAALQSPDGRMWGVRRWACSDGAAAKFQAV